MRITHCIFETYETEKQSLWGTVIQIWNVTSLRERNLTGEDKYAAAWK